jgi:hypothetical protein
MFENFKELVDSAEASDKPCTVNYLRGSSLSFSAVLSLSLSLSLSLFASF